jgi:Ca-activated chloride channel family protein
MTMRFAQPDWFLAGLVAVTFLVVLLVRSERLRSRALALLEGARFRSGLTASSTWRRWLRVAVCSLAVAMGFVALARPQKGMHWETVERKGTDLLLVVDTSKSMDADDVKPTRLERSKLAIRDLVERFPGDRIGLVAFAGDAFVQSPMTLDHTALLESVDALDTSVIARGGTNIGRGIDVATDALVTEPGHQKVMVLLTDGEDLEGQGIEEAKRASAAGITIDTVGVATLAGELVPAKDARGATIGVTRDEAGNPVRSHLDEAGLQAIAAAAHGSYRPLGTDGRGLDRLYDESLAGLTQVDASSRTRRVYSEWFEVPLALALFGLAFDALLGRRWRRAKRSSKAWRGRTPVAAATAAALLLILAAPGVARASTESATKAYAAGHFDDAAKQFEAESTRKPKDARLAFNAGDAAYRAGQYETADAAFKRAVATADPKLQQQILYNDGDVLYRLGESKKPEEREETIAQWKAAIAAYDGAIALDAKDEDARFNRDFVKRKLAELEQKDKDEPKKDEPKDKSKKDESKKDESKKDGKSGGGSGDKDSKGASGGATGKDGKPDSTGTGDPKDSSGSRPAPGKAGAGNEAQPADGSNGSKHAESGAPPAPAAGEPRAGGSPPGQTSQARAGGEGRGDEGKDAQSGRLSPRDARALVGALRGDERRGPRHGTDVGEPSDDAPRKDW